jgi:hypothetical protein
VLPTIVQAAASIGATFNVYRVSAGPAVATPGAAPEAPASAPAADPEVDTLTLWSEIIAAIEEVVDGLSKPGRFAMTFKEVLVARAPTYPFLDPFAAEFEYSGQRVQFAGDPPNDFNRGLGDCLVDTVSRLAFQLKRADLETRIRERLADFPGRHSAVIDKFQLSDDIQEFVA